MYKYKKFIKPISIIMYTSFAIIALACGGLALFLHENWVAGEIVTLSSAILVTLSICGLMLYKEYKSLPKWITAQGVGVWESIPWFDATGRMVLNKSIDLFINIVSTEKQIPKYQLLLTLQKLNVEWTTKSISLVGVGWTVQDKAGVQQGNNIMVQWLGDLYKSAFVHELIHFIRTQHCHLPTDYAHKDYDWWYLENKINNYIRNTMYIGEC